MARYARGWKCAAITIAALGLTHALLTESAFAVVAAFGAAAAVATCVALGVTIGQGTVSEPQRFTPVFAIACWVTVSVALFVIGAYALLGIIWLIVATSPRVMAWVLGVDVRAKARAKPATPAVRAPDASQLARMSITGLVHEWRSSYIQLHRTADPAVLIALVAARAGYLDELERRDPSGLHEWLDSGPLAVGDPTAYMHQRPNDDAGGTPRAA